MSWNFIVLCVSFVQTSAPLSWHVFFCLPQKCTLALKLVDWRRFLFSAGQPRIWLCHCKPIGDKPVKGNLYPGHLLGWAKDCLCVKMYKKHGWCYGGVNNQFWQVSHTSVRSPLQNSVPAATELEGSHIPAPRPRAPEDKTSEEKHRQDALKTCQYPLWAMGKWAQQAKRKETEQKRIKKATNPMANVSGDTIVHQRDDITRGELMQQYIWNTTSVMQNIIHWRERKDL